MPRPHVESVGRRERRLGRVRRARIILILAALALAPTAATGASPEDEASALLAARPRRHVPRASSSRLIQPGDLVYLGAFRLPDRASDAEPATFEYGGQGMAYRATGDPSGSLDNAPGSLFVTGFDVHNWVAEVDIPAPVVATRRDPTQLPIARVLQPFSDVRGALWRTLTEQPRVGLCVLSTSSTGEKLHLAWGQHLQDGDETTVASHGWCSPTLADARTAGAWWIGSQSLYSVNGYIMEIPESWAATHVGGRRLATGRFRDGGWSGMGPALFAYAPWLSGNPPAAGTRLTEKPLLLYANTRGEGSASGRLRNYQHPDEWEGGAWLTTGDGRSAVVFAGTKGIGTRYWYGWVNPAGPEQPCVEMAEDGGMCFNADGTRCPAELIRECGGHTSDRGWWSTRFQAQMIFYDPADLAKVAGGTLAADQPQPYATLAIDDRLLLPDPCVEAMSTGTGVQRRYRIGETAYDRARNRIYVLERFADEARPVVHVWQIR